MKLLLPILILFASCTPKYYCTPSKKSKDWASNNATINVPCVALLYCNNSIQQLQNHSL